MALSKLASSMNSKTKTFRCTILQSPFLYRKSASIPRKRSRSDASLHSDGSYPSVLSYTGEWSLDPSSHSLFWSIPHITAHGDSKTGSLIFTVGGDDAAVFFPVDVNFTAQGSLAGIEVAKVAQVDGEEPPFSVDAYITTEDFLVI